MLQERTAWRDASKRLIELDVLCCRCCSYFPARALAIAASLVLISSSMALLTLLKLASTWAATCTHACSCCVGLALAALHTAATSGGSSAGRMDDHASAASTAPCACM